MRPSNNLENTTSPDKFWRVQLVCTKVQVHSSIELPLQYYQDQTPMMPIKGRYHFFNHIGSCRVLCSFRLVLHGKTSKEISESSRLEFLEKFLANNFAWSDAEDNTFRPLNRGGIADLSFLRTLLAIRPKSWEPSFWKLVNAFVLLIYGSLQDHFCKS